MSKLSQEFSKEAFDLIEAAAIAICNCRDMRAMGASDEGELSEAITRLTFAVDRFDEIRGDREEREARSFLSELLGELPPPAGRE